MIRPKTFWAGCGILALAYPAYIGIGLLMNGGGDATTSSLFNIVLWCAASGSLGIKAIFEGLR